MNEELDSNVTGTSLLVAVDGSKHSEKVVDFACTLGKTLSARVALIFVCPHAEIQKEYEKLYTEPRIIPKEDNVMGEPQAPRRANPDAMGIDEYCRVVGDKVLSQLKAKVESTGLKCERIFEVGNPAIKIRDIANERKVDMIIVGLHGLHGADRLRSLGSVSRRIIENSSRPIVVVP